MRYNQNKSARNEMAFEKGYYHVAAPLPTLTERQVSSIIKRIITAKVAYEEFMD